MLKRGMTRKIVGPKDMEDRQCTDVCCLCLFFLFWIGLAGIASIVFASGDISRVAYGSDYMGSQCGIGELAAKPKLWYPRIAQDVYEQSHALISGHPWEIALYGICVKECPVVDESLSQTIADYGYGQPMSHAKARSWSVDLSTTSMINRCIPRESSTTSYLKLCSKPTCNQAISTGHSETASCGARP